MHLKNNLSVFVCLVFISLFSSCKDFIPKSDEHEKGVILILHGISSAGKTSTAKRLQTLLKDPFVYFGIDNFMTMLPERLVNYDPSTAKLSTEASQEGIVFEPMNVQGEQLLVVKVGSFVKKFGTMLPKTLALFANNGFNCITDNAFGGADQGLAETALKKYVQDLRDYKVYFINLMVSSEVAAQREQERGGFKGLAAGQQYSLLKSLTSESYDLEIDTSNLSPDLVAQKIVEFMRSNEDPQAFKILYKNYYTK